MKHAVDKDKENHNYNARLILYPYMASESTMRFCRKFSRYNMACIVGIRSLNQNKSSASLTLSSHGPWRNKWVYIIGKSSNQL